MYISWGNARIDVDEIQYVSRGLWTPSFKARADLLSPRQDECFSVVAYDQILNAVAPNTAVATVWVSGLRRMVGHSDAQSDQLARHSLENGDIHRVVKEQKLRTFKMDLFRRYVEAVFTSLEAEGVWGVDESVVERFSHEKMYKVVRRERIEWRQWQSWVRGRVVEYLEESGRKVSIQQRNANDGNALHAHDECLVM